MAVIAAVVAASAAMHASRKTAKSQRLDRQQRDRHHFALLHESIQARSEEFRIAAIGRCWDRLIWLIGAATSEPALSGPTQVAHLRIGPELVEELLLMLERDAMCLGDITLARAVNVYLMQFGMVLVRQSGQPAPVASAVTQRG